MLESISQYGALCVVVAIKKKVRASCCAISQKDASKEEGDAVIEAIFFTQAHWQGLGQSEIQKT